MHAANRQAESWSYTRQVLCVCRVHLPQQCASLLWLKSGQQHLCQLFSCGMWKIYISMIHLYLHKMRIDDMSLGLPGLPGLYTVTLTHLG